jgi:predicted Zn finger-like uncharacterized protein
MGKRLTCPRCGTGNDYDVPLNEVTAAQRHVPCRSCGHRFVYGFKPEYVTESEAPPREERQPDAAFDSSVEVLRAKERLSRYVMAYPDYHDRDRDIILLHLIDRGDRIDHELAAIKRMLDVFIKRGR